MNVNMTSRGLIHRLCAVLSLSLFLLGNNYCLLVAVAGASGAARLECHATPHDARSSASGCCHSQPAHHESPSSASSSPCCITLAPVSALQLAKPAVSLASVLAVPPAPEIEPSLAASPASAAESRSAPPASLARPPHAGRAPPLA